MGFLAKEAPSWPCTILKTWPAGERSFPPGESPAFRWRASADPATSTRRVSTAGGPSSTDSIDPRPLRPAPQRTVVPNFLRAGPCDSRGDCRGGPSLGVATPRAARGRCPAGRPLGARPGGRTMLNLGLTGTIFVAVEPQDGRKGIDGLAGVVRGVLGCDPATDHPTAATRYLAVTLQLVIILGDVERYSGERRIEPERDSRPSRRTLSQLFTVGTAFFTYPCVSMQ